MNEKKNRIDVRIIKMRNNAVIPEYATEGSAACDLCACIEEPFILECGMMIPIPTGIAISTGRDDIVALIFARSGLGTKYGITLSNGTGVIDSDYRGEMYVTLVNRGNAPYTINPGDRIAQLMFVPVFSANFTVTDKLDETSRGAGGFGSTGI